MEDYSDLTDEQSNTILMSILKECKGDQLADIPGIYEILSEHFNNEVLAIYSAQLQEKYDNT